MVLFIDYEILSANTLICYHAAKFPDWEKLILSIISVLVEIIRLQRKYINSGKLSFVPMYRNQWRIEDFRGGRGRGNNR